MREKIDPSDRHVFLGMPGYSTITGGAARGYWRCSRLPESRICYQHTCGSLLAANFNNLWASALSRVHSGHRLDYFAMQHADIEPQDYWLDTLIDEMEARDLDVLGVVAPIKDTKGVTSLAVAHDSGDPWRIHARITMREIFNLPLTFTSEDLGGRPLLLNTGLWVCRFDFEKMKRLHFTINDRIVFDTKADQFAAQCEPEDWYFSRLCHEQGLKIGATRKIKLTHRGEAAFPNDQVWGEPYDSAWTSQSVVPADPDGFELPDINGWLTFVEGRELSRLARGKRVLEIGSYWGLSTVCLARTASHVVAVDPHDGRGTAAPEDTYRRFLGNLERHGVGDKVTTIRATTEEIVPNSFGEPFDLVFVDGGHDAESVAKDIAFALEVLAPGGLIAVHDYDAVDPDVTAAVDGLILRGSKLVSVSESLAVVSPPAPFTQKGKPCLIRLFEAASRKWSTLRQRPAMLPRARSSSSATRPD